MEKGSYTIHSTIDTGINVDCVESCPFEDTSDLVAVGAYQLKNEQEHQSKFGGILLYVRDHDLESNEGYTL